MSLFAVFPLTSRALRGALGVLALSGALHASAVHAADAAASADTASPMSWVAERFAQDVVRTADAGGRTFGIIDKPQATLWVFDAQGRLLASTPVLVGEATGDVAPPDIGSRPLSRVKKHEKITTAGRFITEAGNNHKSEDIVWLDYDAALSMHRVRNVPGEGRARRLQTPSVADNRISFGCVNIPAGFYDRYIDPLFSRTSGVVYVLPETRPLASVFPFATEGAAALASMTARAAH
ncbi:L,D-transpeptidase [Ottowia sp.]|uniref:L,D-transpeptidase n=1 Tax=Ottowia sp. TaxID=1898956 RepID=UPI002D1FA4AD|nr:L,D-transpeptidase [Ottowia sp.]